MSSRPLLAVAAGLCFTLLAPIAKATDNGKNPEKCTAGVLVQWFDLLYDRVKADSFNPPAASRIYALAGVTAYEAVQPGSNKKPKWLTLQGQLTDLDSSVIPRIDKKSRHWPTVANYALHTLLTGLFTGKAGLDRRVPGTARLGAARVPQAPERQAARALHRARQRARRRAADLGGR